MSTDKRCDYTTTFALSGDTFAVIGEDPEIQTGLLEVTGTGEIKIINTGGSSASEGGMGSDSDDSVSKGDVTKPGGGKTSIKDTDAEDDDTSFDPIKKNVREAEKKAAGE